MKSRAASWLLFLPEIPANQSSLRVRVWRRLKEAGAIRLSTGAYLLRNGDDEREDFDWLLQEIRRGGGKAVVASVGALDGIPEAEAIGLFRRARDAAGPGWARDLRAFRTLVRTRPLAAPAAPRLDRRAYRGRVWVTRPDPKSDRLACAWLVLRFIDPKARIRFARDPATVHGAVAFDAPGAPFTHEGEDCTFEVFVRRFGIKDAGAAFVAEVIHDIDVKDGKFGHPATPGFAKILEGLRAIEKDDRRRLEQSLPLFDWLAASVGAAPRRP